VGDADGVFAYTLLTLEFGASGDSGNGFSEVPEPSTALLLTTGLVLAAFTRRSARRRGSSVARVGKRIFEVR
jgi:hypothetical protein